MNEQMPVLKERGINCIKILIEELTKITLYKVCNNIKQVILLFTSVCIVF